VKVIIFAMFRHKEVYAVEHRPNWSMDIGKIEGSEKSMSFIVNVHVCIYKSN